MTEPSAATDYLSELKTLEKDLQPMIEELTAAVQTNVTVDYSKQGVESMFAALVLVRARGERAAVLHANAIRIRALAESMFTIVMNAYQKRYDKIVVERASTLPDRCSWEERASFYRTAAIDAETYKRQCELVRDRVRAQVQQVEVLAKQNERAKFDLTAIVDVMKFGHTIGEL